MTILRSAAAGLLLAVGVALSGCGQPADDAKPAHGVVRSVDLATAQITIEHGDIPDLMKAMTMTFEVADPALLEDLEEGVEVDFRVRHAAGRYTVTAIEPASSAGP